MPGEIYDKLLGLIAQTKNALNIRVMAGGSDAEVATLRQDLNDLASLEETLVRCRPAYRRAWRLEPLVEPVISTIRPVEDVKQSAVSDAQPEYRQVKSEQSNLEQGKLRQGRIENKNCDEHKDYEESFVGTFKRLPKGGVVVNESGDEIFVPEIWVRNLGIEHGDIISAVPLGVLHDSPLYEFTVEKRLGLGHTSDRIAVVGPVVFHGGEWIVFSDDEDIAISLKPKEVHTLKLREGDLVEVAYPQGEISQARIAWKYEEDSVIEYVRGKPSRPRPEKTKPVVDVADPLLSSRRVLVVGADLYKEAFRQMFERRGAKFLWESGFQGGVGRNIESKVRSADIVVIVTEMMSHRLPSVEGMCRRLNKPYVYAPSKGSTGAIRECQKILQQKFARK